jgi:serine/threonine-protein kinase
MSALTPLSHLDIRMPSCGCKHPCETEQGACLLRERQGLFTRVVFFFSFGFLLFTNTVRFLTADSARTWLESLIGPTNLFHAGSCVLLAALWWIYSRLDLHLRTLRYLDALSMFVLCASFAGLSLGDGTARGNAYTALLAVGNCLLARAVIVPSSASRTVAVSFAACLPGAALGADALSALIPTDDPRFSAQQAFYVAWYVAAVAMAAVVSWVIYGLQREVQQARQLGQYTLEEKVGEGGMGEVYRASHAMLRRPTAVKLLRPEKTGATALARFEREVQLTSRLTHPNTIAIYDYGRTPEGIFYYAMEFLEGLTLEELVRKDGPQSPARAILILQQVCASLAEAHAVGLIHRDIKPANVILCQRGGMHDVVKVVDFGLVKDIAQRESIAVSAANVVTGTPLYLSPEGIRSPEKVDARSDLYAVGAVAYYIVSGKQLFDSQNFVEICSHHLHTVPERPSRRLGRPLPADLEGLILLCLEKDPARRPKDARALSEALGVLADAGGWSEADAAAWWAEKGKDLVARRFSPESKELHGVVETTRVAPSRRATA